MRKKRWISVFMAAILMATLPMGVQAQEDETTQQTVQAEEQTDKNLEADKATDRGSQRETSEESGAAASEQTPVKEPVQDTQETENSEKNSDTEQQEPETEETEDPVTVGTTSLSSETDATAITLKWKVIKDVSGYEIQRSTSKDSGFKVIATIESGKTDKYADKDTKLETTYYYQIRGFQNVDEEKVYGEWSKVRTQKKRIAAPVIKKTKGPSYSSVKLYWNKIKGANGYQIYRSSKENGTYKKISTITKGTVTAYTNTKLPLGTSYYYKIRAYYKSGKHTYYSAFSKIKKGSTKQLDGQWKYVNGYKLYYDKNGKLVKDVSEIIGKQSSYVINVNKRRNCVTIYAKDGENGYILPVKAFPCSAGYATPITTARTPVKYRWHALNGNCYGQWCTRIKQGYLFHSVMYGKTKNTTLSVSNYNKLGTTASHGCIRLRAGDAKWIYDNCKLKTKVIIYNGSSAGPLGKPSAAKLPKWHKWDPTDPTAKHLCKKRGCH